jgi:diguanylate cyclase (GGDEF)-like protein
MPNFNDSELAGSSPDALSVRPFTVVPFPSFYKFSPASSRSGSAECDSSARPPASAAINGSLEKVARRERQLWVTLGGLSLVITVGMVLVVLPQLMELSNERPDKWYLPRLFLGLVALMALLNLHLTRQRHSLHQTREALLKERERRQIAEAAAIVDPLTQSFNRRYMDDLIEKELSRAGRLGTQIAFLMVDVDDFKSVNTRFGHIVGDTILREVADVVRRSVRASDTVVRYGGDEFLVILSDAAEPDAERVITRIDQRVLAWNNASKIEGYCMGLSCGWALHGADTPVNVALEAADMKMYACRHLRRIGASAEA